MALVSSVSSVSLVSSVALWTNDQNFWLIQVARHKGGKDAIFTARKGYLLEKPGGPYDISRIVNQLNQGRGVWATLYSPNKQSYLLYEVVKVEVRTALQLANICHQMEGKSSLAPAGASYGGTNPRCESREVLRPVYGQRADTIADPNAELLVCLFMRPIGAGLNIMPAARPSNKQRCLHIW